MNTAELDQVFSTSPGNPWAAQKFPDTTLSDEAGAVTLQGWLAQWRYVFLRLQPNMSPNNSFRQYDDATRSQNYFGILGLSWIPGRATHWSSASDKAAKSRPSKRQSRKECIFMFSLRCSRVRIRPARIGAGSNLTARDRSSNSFRQPRHPIQRANES